MANRSIVISLHVNLMSRVVEFDGTRWDWASAQSRVKGVVVRTVSLRRLYFLVEAIALTFAFDGRSVNAQQGIVGSWEFVESTAGFTPNGPLWWWNSKIVIKSVDKGVTVSWKTHAEIRNTKTGASKIVLDENRVDSFFGDDRDEVNKMEDGSKSFSRSEWRGNKFKITYYSDSAENKKRAVLGKVDLGISKGGQKLFLTKTSSGENSSATVNGVLIGYIWNRKDTFKRLDEK